MASSRTARTIASAADPALIPLGSHEGKPPFLLTRPVFVIGSRNNARIHLVSSTVSKAHALLVRSNGGVYIRDLASRTKVIVNGKVQREADLQTGDELQIGRFTFRYRGTPDVPHKAAETPAARLRVAGQDLPIPIDQRVLLIGRRIVCDVHLLEESVSTAHAVIFEVDGHRFIRDLGSRTGTYVNGVSTHQHQLVPGDKIRIGETDLTYELGVAVGAADEAVAAETTPDALDLIADLIPDEKVKANAPTIDLPVEMVDSSAVATVVTTTPDTVDLLADLPAAEKAEADAPTVDLPIEIIEPADPTASEPDAFDPATHQGPESLPLALEPLSGESAVVEPELLDLPVMPEEVEPVSAEPSEPEPQVADVFPLEVNTRDELEPIELTEPPVDLPAAELSEVAVGESLQPVVEAPLEEVLPPAVLEEASAAAAPPEAAIVADEPAKRGRGKKKPAEPAPSAKVDEPKPKGKAAKVKKPPAPKKRGKPTPPPAIAEAPIVEVAPTDIVEPQPVEPPSLIEPAAITPLGVVEPEATEPELMVPREPTDLEISEPSARGPLIEPVTPDTVVPKAASPDPILAAELAKLPTQPIARDEVEPIATAPIPPPPTVVGQLPVEKLASIVEQTIPDGVATDTSPIDLDAELEALLSDKVERVSNRPTTSPLSDEDSLELEALLAKKEERPAADIDHIIDTPTASQTEAPDEAVDEQLAVSPEDLSVDPLIEPTSDPATPSVKPDFSGTQAAGLADRIAAPEAEDHTLRADKPDVADEPDVAASQAGKLLERVRWTANHDNSLGGQPLHLADAKPSALSETPLLDETQQGEITSPDEVGQTPSVNGHALAAEDRPASQPLSLSSFEGLAHSPLREMDVFSQMSPPAEEELIDAEVVNAASGEEPVGEKIERPRGTISGVFGEPIEQPAHRQRVRPDLSSITAQAQPVRGEVSEAEARRLRQKYVRRVSTLVGLMVLLIGGAAVAIYNLLGVSSSVDAALRFKNLGSLKQIDRNAFIADQLTRLKLDTTRKLARRTLNEKSPEIASGFLDDQIDYIKTLDASGFSANDPEVLLFRIVGSDAAADAARGMSIASAMYQINGTMLDDARKRQSAVDELNRSINDTQTQLQSIGDAINKLRLTGESGPSLERRQELDAQLSKAETNWKNAVAAVTTTEAVLNQMKAAAPGTAIDSPTPAPSIANDTQMAQLQQQLADSQAQIKANREAAAQAAADARKNLDDTLNGFQKQVADAQGMAGNNPEFTAYIASAQRLQETLKQLTDDLIHRQEQQLGKLIELKDQAAEKMEVRRQEMLLSDNQLKDLIEQQAILTRQLNTALGTGLQRESDELKARLDLNKSMIKARQDLLPGDAFYADTIQRLQNLIDATRKNIADDRTKTEQQLTSLQASFTSSQVVERLPEEQKALATALSQRLSDINNARRQYGQTLDAGIGDNDDALKSQTATIQAAIESRQKQLADANLQALRANQERDRLAAIDAKQSELTKLRTEEQGLQRIYFAKQREVRDAQANADAAKDNSDKLDNLIRQQGALKADLQSKTDQVGLRQSQASGVIEPQKPAESDLVIRRGEDKRLLYTLISSGTLLAVFFSLIVWTLHTAHLVVPHTSLQATDLQPVEPAATTRDMPVESPADAEPASV